MLATSMPASLALDSIEVRCAGKSGICSDVVGMLLGVRKCDEANGRPCKLPEMAGAVKVNCEEGATDVEKFDENCCVAQLSFR